MAEMTIKEALEILAELNEGMETLVKTNSSAPMYIEYAIEEVMQNAEDPDEVFDLRVTEDTIREYDENGYIRCEETLYRVVKN